MILCFYLIIITFFNLLSYINSEEAFKNLDYKTAKLLETIMKVDIPNDGGYNMCKAIEDIKTMVSLKLYMS